MIIMDDGKGNSCSVDESGYVDFNKYDKQYASEKEALADLESQGWHVVGWE